MINISDFRPGSHTLTITATSEDGRQDFFLISFTVFQAISKRIIIICQLIIIINLALHAY